MPVFRLYQAQEEQRSSCSLVRSIFLKLACEGQGLEEADASQEGGEGARCLSQHVNLRRTCGDRSLREDGRGKGHTPLGEDHAKAARISLQDSKADNVSHVNLR